MNHLENTPKSPEPKNAEAQPAACCSTDALATCCEPSAKAGCCGAQAETAGQAPRSCGCR